MNTNELLDVLKARGWKKKDAKKMLNDILDIASSVLNHEKELKLFQFGSFKNTIRFERTWRNPKTNEKITIPQHNTVIFKPYKKLKQYINN